MIYNIKKKKRIKSIEKLCFAFLPTKTRDDKIVWLEKYYSYSSYCRTDLLGQIHYYLPTLWSRESKQWKKFMGDMNKCCACHTRKTKCTACDGRGGYWKREGKEWHNCWECRFEDPHCKD